MQININFISIIISASIVLGLFISILILTVKKKNKTPNIFLALFLLTITFIISGAVIYETRAFQYIPYLIRVNEPFRFLAAPFFYFYTIALCHGKLKWNRYLPLHFIPFIANIIILMPFFILPSDLKIKFIMDNFFKHQVSFIAYNFILFIIMLIQFTFYFFLAKKEIRVYESGIKDKFSSIETISLSWLNSFTNAALVFSIFLLIFCIFLLFIIILWPLRTQWNMPFRPFPVIISLLLIILVFKALRQPQVLGDLSANTMNNKPGEKYVLSTLLPEEAEQYSQELSRYLEKEKPYLDPELTLQQIADELSIPVRHLSQVINEKMGMNFYNYINSFRIEEIKRYLSDPEFSKETILNLAYNAGFNSKATFNAVFKKFTGLTPQQFRRVTPK